MPTDLGSYDAAKVSQGRLSSYAVLTRENERLKIENRSIERSFDRLYEQAYAAQVQLKNLEAVISKGALGGSTFATTQLLRLATDVLELLARRPEQPCIALIPEALGCLSSCQIRDKHLFAAGQKLRRAISSIDRAVAQGRRISLKPIGRAAGQVPLDLRWLASVAGDLSWLNYAEQWQQNPLDLRWAAVAVDDPSLLLHRYAWQSAPIDLRYLTVLTGDMDWLHIGAKRWQETPMEIRLRAISRQDPTLLWPKAAGAAAAAVRELQQAEVAEPLPVLLPGLSPEEDLDISLQLKVGSDLILETEKLRVFDKVMRRKSALDVDNGDLLRYRKVISEPLDVAKEKPHSITPTGPLVQKGKAEAPRALTPSAEEIPKTSLEKKSRITVSKAVDTLVKEGGATKEPLAKTALLLETKKSVLLPARKTVPPVTKPHGGSGGAGEKTRKETSPVLPEAAPSKGSSKELITSSLKKSSSPAEKPGDTHIIEKKLTPVVSTVGESSTVKCMPSQSKNIGELVKQKKAPASSSVDKKLGPSLRTPSEIPSETDEKKTAQAPSPPEKKIGSPLTPPPASVSKSVHTKTAPAPRPLEKKIPPSAGASEPVEKEKTPSASQLQKELSASVVSRDAKVLLEKKVPVASPAKAEPLSLHLSSADGGKAVEKQEGLGKSVEEPKVGSPPLPPTSAGEGESKGKGKELSTTSIGKQVGTPPPHKAPPFKGGKAAGPSDAIQPKAVVKSAAVGMSPSKLLEELRARVGKEPPEKEEGPLTSGAKKIETPAFGGEATKPGEGGRTSKESMSKSPPTKKTDTLTDALPKSETLPSEKVTPNLVKKGESATAKGDEKVKEFVQPPATKVMLPKVDSETKEGSLEATAQEPKSTEGGGKRKAPVSLVAPTKSTSATKLTPLKKVTPPKKGEETKVAKGVEKAGNITLPSAAPKKKAAPDLQLLKKNHLLLKKQDLPNSAGENS